MYIQENLTTTPNKVPDVSWHLPDSLVEKFNKYQGVSKLIFNEDKTAIIDIIEDEEKKSAREKLLSARREKISEFEGRLNKQAEKSNLEKLAIITMGRIMFRSLCGEMENDDIIRCRSLAYKWNLGKHTKGEICTVSDYPYKCIQDHDTATRPDITPDGTAWATFWTPYHGTTLETALPYVQPIGTHDIYKAGEYIIWPNNAVSSTDSFAKSTSSEVVMRANRNTSYSPDEDPSAWGKQ